MTTAVFAQLTADRTQIALLPVTDDEWTAEPGAAPFRRLTPKPVLHEENGLRTGVILVPASWPVLTQLNWSFNGRPGYSLTLIGELEDWAIAESSWRTAAPPPLAQELPAGLKPRPYQVTGAEMIAHAGKFLLLDDAGLGKTPITIMGVEERRVRGHGIFPMIIVVPSWEVGDSWREHILRWAPAWGMPRLHGGPNRVNYVGARNRAQYARDVFITTYATLRQDAADDRGPLSRLEAATVVLDEVHWIRNPDTAQTRAAKRIAKHATTFVGCSGTGIARNTADILPPVQIMFPGAFPEQKRFRGRYLVTVEDDAGYGERVTGLDPAMAGEFYAAIWAQWHRFAKGDVLPELPPKIYSKLMIDIPDPWRAVYDQMETDWLAELPDGGEMNAMDTLVRLTRLSQLASSAADVRIEHEWDEALGLWVPHQIVTLKAPSWKAEALLRFLAERPGQPTAVFTESRQLAMITGAECENAGLRTGYIVGAGDGTEASGRITNRTRGQARADFQAGLLDVIICTAGAGGTGITLTAANCAAMLQRSFQYDLGTQPEDRVHRIGAEIHDHVQIADFVATRTVDQRRRDVLREKGGMLGELVQDARIIRELLGGRR